MARAAQRRPVAPQHKTTTIREFDGGWNVVEDELNITPKYSKVLDNWTRRLDGSLQIRPGTRLVVDFTRFYSETPFTLTDIELRTNDTEPHRLHLVGTGLVPLVGDRFIIDTITPAAVGGVDASLLPGIWLIDYVDEGSDLIIIHRLDINFTLTGVFLDRDLTGKVGGLLVHGDIVNATWYRGNFIVVTTVGEVARWSTDLPNGEKLWDASIAAGQAGSPPGWGPTDRANFFNFGGQLIILNGSDKPLQVDLDISPKCQYLTDPASGSNFAIPIAAIGTISSNYTVLSGRDGPSSFLDISAKYTDSVFVGNPDPDDATDIDMAKLVDTNNADVVGLGVLRNYLVVGFGDTLSIGQLGQTKSVADTIVHDPQFPDQIYNMGCLSHRTIVSFGNDLFMCDLLGVPWLRQSQLSGQITPDRVSEIIQFELQANIARIPEAEFARRAFAVYNGRDKQYMLFIPRFSETDSNKLPIDPIAVDPSLPEGTYAVSFPSHSLEVGDVVTVAGVTVSGSPVAGFNGTKTVFKVIDDNTLLLVGTGPEGAYVDGGQNVTISRPNVETIGYIYTYNPQFKIRFWSRYRGFNFDWATRNPAGFVYFGKGLKIWQLGVTEQPISADETEDFDFPDLFNGQVVNVNQRVKGDGWAGDNIIYLCTTSYTVTDYTAPLDEEHWAVYEGRPIKFVWEWPWMDFDKRMNTKILRGIHIDANGSAAFNLKIFVDKLYKNELGDFINTREMQFVADQQKGYGGGTQTYGTGRRTKEEVLWLTPALHKLLKLRVDGETTKPLRMLAVSLVYHEGSIKR